LVNLFAVFRRYGPIRSDAGEEARVGEQVVANEVAGGK
jgi:hypothetical protein